MNSKYLQNTTPPYPNELGIIGPDYTDKDLNETKFQAKQERNIKDTIRATVDTFTKDLAVQYPDGGETPALSIQAVIPYRTSIGKKKTLGRGAGEWKSQYAITYVCVGLPTKHYKWLVAAARVAAGSHKFKEPDFKALKGTTFLTVKMSAPASGHESIYTTRGKTGKTSCTPSTLFAAMAKGNRSISGNAVFSIRLKRTNTAKGNITPYTLGMTLSRFELENFSDIKEPALNIVDPSNLGTISTKYSDPDMLDELESIAQDYRDDEEDEEDSDDVEDSDDEEQGNPKQDGKGADGDASE